MNATGNSRNFCMAECFFCVRALAKIDRLKSGDDPDCVLDLNTGKYFFASLAHVLEKSQLRSNEVREIWTKLSGESQLPCSDADIVELRKGANIDQLKKVFDAMDSKKFNQIGTKSLRLNVVVKSCGSERPDVVCKFQVNRNVVQ
jgi:hypothetical protein